MIKRIKDIDPKIRKNTFCLLNNNLQIETLPKTQLQYLLTEGLCDRDESVRNECTKMCENWFTKLGEDFLKWLTFLDYKKNEYLAELSCYLLLHSRYYKKFINLSNVPIIDFQQQLNLDSLFFYRVFSFFFYTHQNNVKKFFFNFILISFIF